MENINNIRNLSYEEMNTINGGDAIGTAATLALAYFCWMANFCYNLGKD